MLFYESKKNIIFRRFCMKTVIEPILIAPFGWFPGSGIGDDDDDE